MWNRASPSVNNGDGYRKVLRVIDSQVVDASLIELMYAAKAAHDRATGTQCALAKWIKHRPVSIDLKNSARAEKPL